MLQFEAYPQSLGPDYGAVSKPIASAGVGKNLWAFRVQRVQALLLIPYLLLLAGPGVVLADPAAVAQRVGKLLQIPHHAEHLLVGFNPATSFAARQAVHDSVAAELIRTDRYLEGACLVRIPSGNLSAALNQYLNDPTVRYAEPDYYIYPEYACPPDPPPPPPFPGDNEDTYWYSL